mmetsp:Transcript_68753/g.212598  ORF Transcript_68753/g.212598 Transcript_68753/m.212598 type:complete len:649 (-) Transcript_68753:1619-3565(-)
MRRPTRRGQARGGGGAGSPQLWRRGLRAHPQSSVRHGSAGVNLAKFSRSTREFVLNRREPGILGRWPGRQARGGSADDRLRTLRHGVHDPVEAAGVEVLRQRGGGVHRCSPHLGVLVVDHLHDNGEILGRPGERGGDLSIEGVPQKAHGASRGPLVLRGQRQDDHWQQLQPRVDARYLPQDGHHALPDGLDIVPRPLQHVGGQNVCLSVGELHVQGHQLVQQDAEDLERDLPDLCIGVEEHPRQPLQQHVQDLHHGVRMLRDLVLPSLKRKELLLHSVREHAAVQPLVHACLPALPHRREVLCGDRFRAPMLATVALLPNLLRLLGGLYLEGDARRRREGSCGVLAAHGARGAFPAGPRLAAGSPWSADAARCRGGSLRRPWRGGAARRAGPREPPLGRRGLMLLCSAGALCPRGSWRRVAWRGGHHAAGRPQLRAASAAVRGLPHAALRPRCWRRRGSHHGLGNRPVDRRPLGALHPGDLGAQGLDLCRHLLYDGGLQDALLVQLRHAAVGCLLGAPRSQRRGTPRGRLAAAPRGRERALRGALRDIAVLRRQRRRRPRLPRGQRPVLQRRRRSASRLAYRPAATGGGRLGGGPRPLLLAASHQRARLVWGELAPLLLEAALPVHGIPVQHHRPEVRRGDVPVHERR